MILTQRQALQITLTRPRRDTTIVHLAGDLDDRSVLALEELLTHRLRSCLRTVVVDLTELAYLSPRAGDMLTRHAGQAWRHHTHLVILPSTSTPAMQHTTQAPLAALRARSA